MSFFTLKTNKSPGYDNLYVSAIKSMYHELKTPLIIIFSQSLSTGIFSDKMKLRKFHLYLKMVKNLLHPIIDQYLHFHVFKKF